MAIIGIDLGTTNSLVSVWKDGRCQLIPNAFGERLTPSVVSLEDGGEILVGKAAKERLISHPMQSAAGFKQFMGTQKSYMLGNRSFLPEELSSFVLRQLKQDAEAYLGEMVQEAIISVPAYFNDQQRTATKNAGRLAGLRVERIINEPSAAALAYNGGSEMDGTYLVFDFGGGTLDISIVEMFQNIVDINGVAGDNRLGGNDIDQAILEEFLRQNPALAGTLSANERASLLKLCEQSKIALSSTPNHIMVYQRGKHSYAMGLTNQSLSKICNTLLARIKTLLQRALKSTGYSIAQITDIILVGGSSRMPMIEQFIEYITQKKPLRDIDPDQVVACGAGLVAGIKERCGDIRDMILTDVCPFTLGIATVMNKQSGQRVFMPIIQRNSALPVSVERTVYTLYDNQKSVMVRIYQGEFMNPEENLYLGEVELHVPPLPAGEVSILVCFTYDINGILEVDVSCPLSGEAKNKILVSNKGLSEAEIEAHVAALQQLKISRREDAENKHVIAWGERLFEEADSMLREGIAARLDLFIGKLNAGGSPVQIERIRRELIDFFSKIDGFDDGLLDFPEFEDTLGEESDA